jgi:hypothetical protein
MLISHTKHDIQWHSINYPTLMSPVYISGLVWRMRQGWGDECHYCCLNKWSACYRRGWRGGGRNSNSSSSSSSRTRTRSRRSKYANEGLSPLELDVYIVFRLILVQWADYKLDGTSLIPARPCPGRLSFPLSFLLTGYRCDCFSGDRGVKLTPHLCPMPVSRIRCAVSVLPHTPSWRVA